MSKRKTNKKSSTKQLEIETESDTEPNDNPASPKSFGFITNEQLEQILKDNQKSTEACIKNAESRIKDAIKQELASMKQEIVRLQSELETASGVAMLAMQLN